MPLQSQELLRTARTLLRDYQNRIDKLGAEALRLPEETAEAWERKREDLAIVIFLVETEIVDREELA